MKNYSFAAFVQVAFINRIVWTFRRSRSVDFLSFEFNSSVNLRKARDGLNYYLSSLRPELRAFDLFLFFCFFSSNKSPIIYAAHKIFLFFFYFLLYFLYRICVCPQRSFYVSSVFLTLCQSFSLLLLFFFFFFSNAVAVYTSEFFIYFL